MTQWDCGLKFIYLLSLLEIVLSLEQQAYLFPLYKFPYILNSLFTSSRSKPKTLIFHITRLNTGTAQFFRRRKRLRLKTSRNRNLICKCLELLILAVFGWSWLCVQSTVAVIESREAPDRSISEPTCGEKHPVSVSSLGWNIWPL